MQFRELCVSELNEGYLLISSLRLDLTQEQFDQFLSSQFPRDYRPIGAFEQGVLRIYAGVSIRENLEYGRHLIVDDFIAAEGFENHSHEMVDFLGDYAKMHGCKEIVIWGKQRGISLDDLKGFRPKRDGFRKNL